MKRNASLPLLLVLALATASCTNRRAPAGEAVSDAAALPSSAASTSSPKPLWTALLPRPPPPAGSVPSLAPGRACTKVGCDSGVTFIAHLHDSPAELATNGTFRMCHAADCWNGTFVASSTPGGLGACQITRADYVPAHKPHCIVWEEGAGSRLEVTHDGGRFVEGEPASLRVVVGGKTVVDQKRRVHYRRYEVNAGCGGALCWDGRIEL